MTDKQIIIDGIDVSGCKFYLPYSEKCECIVDDNGNNNLFCREYRDCYYKRMYHTGQEKDVYKNENKELYKLLKTKEQECEELKEQLERADEDIKMKCTRCAMTNLLDEQLDQLKAQLLDQEAETLKAGGIISKYKQTLTEIKEIAENGCYDDCGMPLDELSIILQKISECEGNDGL